MTSECLWQQEVDGVAQPFLAIKTVKRKEPHFPNACLVLTELQVNFSWRNCRLSPHGTGIIRVQLWLTRLERLAYMHYQSNFNIVKAFSRTFDTNEKHIPCLVSMEKEVDNFVMLKQSNDLSTSKPNIEVQVNTSIIF